MFAVHYKGGQAPVVCLPACFTQILNIVAIRQLQPTGMF